MVSGLLPGPWSQPARPADGQRPARPMVTARPPARPADGQRPDRPDSRAAQVKCQPPARIAR